MGGKSGGNGGVVDPYQAANADFLYNRPNIINPYQAVINTMPGQTPPTGQQIGFIPGGLTGGAQSLFGQMPQSSPTGQQQMPNASKGTQGQMPTPTMPSGPQATAFQNGNATAQMQSAATPYASTAASNVPTQAGGTWQNFNQMGTGFLPGGGRYDNGNYIPKSPPDWSGTPEQWTQLVKKFNEDPNAFRNGIYTQDPSSALGLPPGSLFGRSGKTYADWITAGVRRDQDNNPGLAFGTQNATQTTILPPALLALQNGQTAAQANNLADVLTRQQSMANGGLPSLVSGLNMGGLPGVPQNLDQFNNRTIQSMFQLGMEPLNRQYARQYDQTEQSLANKGLAYPGEAASRQMSDLYREQAQGIQNLALQSVLAGGQESSRSLGDILAARQGSVGEQQANAQLAGGSRLQLMNELNSLLGMAPVGGGGQQGGAFQPFDMAGAYGLNAQGKQNQANMNAATKGSNTSAGAGLASTLAMLAFM